MKVTAWTNEDYARKHYIDPDMERLMLINPDRKFLSPSEMNRLAEAKNMPLEDFYNEWWENFKKIPFYINEAQAQKWAKLFHEMEECVIQTCKEEGIRFSSFYHQNGEQGIPIIDDNYMFMTSLRCWGHIMALADGDKSDRGYLRYYLYSDKEPIRYPHGNRIGE